MPKLWKVAIDQHRRGVREAVLDTTAALVAEHGVLSVTMSRIAEQSGIGRATLYKYFPDVEAILVTWHERQVQMHLQQLVEAGSTTAGAVERLESVLSAFAYIAFERHGTELAAILHQGEHVTKAHQELRNFIQDLITEGAANGAFRGDVPPNELATYSLHALSAAGNLSSDDAVRRLVSVTMAGLLPPS